MSMNIYIHQLDDQVTNYIVRVGFASQDTKAVQQCGAKLQENILFEYERAMQTIVLLVLVHQMAVLARLSVGASAQLHPTWVLKRVGVCCLQMGIHIIDGNSAIHK